MSNVSTRLLTLVALVVTTALLPSGSVSAQGPLVATARMSSSPMTRTGVDSGKLMVALKISGIPEIGLRYLRLDQIVLVDAFGRAYTPLGVGISARGAESKPLLTAWSAPQAERLADRQYLFLVAPGLNTFEVRVANLKPVRVVASVTGPSR